MADDTTDDKPAQEEQAEKKEEQNEGAAQESQPDQPAAKADDKPADDKPAKAEAKADDTPSKEYSKEVGDIVAKVEKMTVLEVADLVSAIEDKFGVSAAPVAVAGAAPAAGDGDAGGA